MKLNNIMIDSKKIYANQPRFERKDPKGEAGGARNRSIGRMEGAEVFRRDGDFVRSGNENGRKTFANVVS